MAFFFMILVLVLHARPREQVVTLDTKQIINQMIMQNQSKIEQPNFIESVSTCLSEVIEDYAKEHHALIVPTQAAIAGNKDITLEIKAQMQQRCLKHG